MRKAVLGLALLAAAMTCSPATAETSYTFEDVSLGDVWYGDPVDLADLLGRVVVIELWGRN